MSPPELKRLYKLHVTFSDLLKEIELSLIDFQEISRSKSYEAEFNQYTEENIKLKNALWQAYDFSGIITKYPKLIDDTSDWYTWTADLTNETDTWLNRYN